MTVLGIETATIVCGIAIIRNGVVLSEEQVVEKNIHAESIMRLLDDAVGGAGLPIRDVDVLAVSVGPGSFTGLRIGLSVAKGLAYALEKPIVAVPTLHALARRILDRDTASPRYILPALEARREEVYCQLLRVEGTEILAEGEARDLPIDSLPDFIGDRNVVITGDALQRLQHLTRHERVRLAARDVASCSAASVALLGEEMAVRREFSPVATLEPEYIKDFFTTQRN